MARPTQVRRRLLAFALGFPGAWLDHPWDEDVVKVGKKVFVFFGMEDMDEKLVTIKLDDSRDQALAVNGAEPAGYGLGRSGWVTIPLRDTTPPAAVLEDWIDESYRRVAPRRLVAELDALRTG
ncbi:MAG TPA: MmcQ/YjbR family DNA-binding protein [Actinomycetota bacterium]|jgi:predicted DNA-binding protein (MmcQ/YjbR family)|nr:MmcQ/YjbR family DNA-binding protein [Actinomycetota bacterium]